MTDVYEALVELGRSLYPGNEAMAVAFARGRAGSEREAREELGTMPAAGREPGGSGTVPSGLYPEVERSVAQEAAAFGLSGSTARSRVMQLVTEKLPAGIESTRRALLAHQARLGGTR